MAEDFTMGILNEALGDYIAEMKQAGLTDSEVLENLSTEKIEQTLQRLVSVISTDTVNFVESSMYEKVLFERTRAAEFMARNEQIWAKGFVASEAMYIVTCEFAEEYNSYVSERAQEKMQDCQFRFIALREIHGRSCQQFLEIVYLLKAGFADGAYARWRSLYELSVVAQFIQEQESEEVARAYFTAANTDDKDYNWAKSAPCFTSKTYIRFSDLQKACKKPQGWIEQYKLSCKVVHASAQGTFGRLGNGPNTPNIVPVGHSDYGLALPAINSALSLAMTSIIYFGLIHYGDSIVYIKIIQRWAELIRDYYTEIETTCFSNENTL